MLFWCLVINVLTLYDYKLHLIQSVNSNTEAFSCSFFDKNQKYCRQFFRHLSHCDNCSNNVILVKNLWLLFEPVVQELLFPIISLKPLFLICFSKLTEGVESNGDIYCYEFVNIACKICMYYLFLYYNISDKLEIFIFGEK